MDVAFKDKDFITFLTQSRKKNVSFEAYIQGLMDQIKKRIEDQEGFAIDNDDTVAGAKYVVKQAYERFGEEKMALAWTGGKDSTLLLWVVKQVVEENDYRLPQIVFINEGYVFDEVIEFTKKLADDWGFDFVEVSNKDVLKQVNKVGDRVQVKRLNERNQKELKRLDFQQPSFVFEPESMVGNHLMKTVVQNLFIEKYGIEALFTGIRWDEQDARGDEHYFSPRGDANTPDHVRVHPLLHMKEKDVWEIIRERAVPYCPLYAQGYRSLGAKGTTKKVTDVPAWEQDLEATKEREGRQQDKEEIMQRLRDLGYM
jgi:phosphoadenosine phosphosulfate reductase